jgi:RluA family pseudouridine synthase
MSFKIREVYQDSAILCIEKPAGTLSIPDRYDPTKKNLLHYLRNKYPGILPVHRLDRDTSGIMIWALSDTAHKYLSQQFESRTVKKKYLAIVEGSPNTDSGEINASIQYGSSGKGFVKAKGKESVSHWKLIEKFNGFSLLEVTPMSGRTHQIRIHLQHIGLPLVVDSYYGNRSELFAYQVKPYKKFRFSKNAEERPLISRHPLHASEITILHPLTKKEVTFMAEPPKDFRALLNQIRKWRTLG